jgi:hypothetical protein
MNDAAQIRRCSGALCANHLLVPAPDPKISNREPLRRVRAVNHLCDCKAVAAARRNDDVIHVTQTKQTPELLLRRGGPLAPPDLRPSFRPSSLRPPPTGDPNLRSSNREAVRLEINVTQTKQTTQPHSYREEEALFSTAGGNEKRAGLKARPYYGNGEQNSNREALRLEINVTQTKQTTQPHSNREAEALFSNRVRADDSARRYIARSVNRPPRPVREPRRLVRARLQSCRNGRRFLPALAAEGMFLRFSLTIGLPLQPVRGPQLTIPTSNFHSKIPNFQAPKKAKSVKNQPQSLFRLERTSTVCFQQLTRNLNEPMFRLEIQKGGKKRSAIRTRERPRA